MSIRNNRQEHFYLGDMTTFHISKTMHNKIMEIIGVKNNQFKKDFVNYAIYVKRNGFKK